MEGAKLGWGAVAAVQGVRHPISVARQIMDEKPMLLVARSGERFAAEHGAEMCAKEDLIGDEQQQESEEEQEVIDRPNTVGCAAIDFLAGDRHPDEAAQMAIATLTQRVSGEAGSKAKSLQPAGI